MKSSTLHRAGLSRENMSALESSRTVNLDRSEYVRSSSALNRTPKNPELDVLWRSVGKTHDTRVVKPKAPGVYLAIGFIAGALFMGLISLIAGFSNLGNAPKTEEIVAVSKPDKANVAIIGADTVKTVEDTVTEEKYEIKGGDTLDKIAVRFYGKYDVEKINEIQKLNNITDPSSLQIGQVILIPVNHAR